MRMITYKLIQAMFCDPVPEKRELHLTTRVTVVVDLLLLAVETLLCVEPPGVHRPEESEDLGVVHGEMMVRNEVYAQTEHLLTTALKVLMSALDVFHG